MHATQAEAKKAGWYSRRHRTSKAAEVARTNHKLSRGRSARRNKAFLRWLTAWMHA